MASGKTTAVVILGGAALVAALLFYRGRTGAAAAMPAAAAPEVTVVALQQEALTLTTELPGRTAPYLVAEIRPQVSGIVQKRAFTEGATVRAGDLLYQIDPAPFQAALDSAAASLDVARKAADRARAALTVSQANANRQKAVLELAKINRDRALKLFKESIIPASQRDAAVTEAEVAAASLSANEAQVESDRQSIASAEAAVKQAEAAVAAARINLGYTAIAAPISGRIGKSAVTIGAMVTGYQAAALTTIQQLDPIYVDVPQSTNALLQLQRRFAQDRNADGLAAEHKVGLILEDGSAYPLEGSVQFRDITVDSSTGTVTIRARFPNPQGILLAGVFVRAVIHEGVDQKALLIPQQAVGRDGKGQPFAYVVSGANVVERRALTLGQVYGARWQVGGGVAPGERVVIEGSQKVKPGMTVRPVSADAAAPASASAAQPAH